MLNSPISLMIFLVSLSTFHNCGQCWVHIGYVKRRQGKLVGSSDTIIVGQGACPNY